MQFILSVSTIPTRIDYLIKILPLMDKIDYKYFVINICQKYKRFGDFKIPRSLIILCKNNSRIKFQFIDDNGPANKLIGGFSFMKKTSLINDKLIIIDDDTLYSNELFSTLLENKKVNNITTGSGFDFVNDNYKIVVGKTEMVEGYAGICFDYNQDNDFINWYVNFYKHFTFGKSNTLIQQYLSASFLGDDFIISYMYENKIAIENGRNLIGVYDYGFNADALHKNNEFGSNMGSYKFLNDNIKILETFKNKYNLFKELKSMK
tara:strand:- start:364 stop:1152 length:789 start_codon:yes stop_codon:yes gene_type:complete